MPELKSKNSQFQKVLKINIKRLFILTVMCLLSSCNIKLPTQRKVSDKIKYANAIRSKVARKLKLEHNLQLCGTGGQMMYEIKMLALSFDYYKPLDVKKGRELLVAAVNELVDAINADEKIRPYLYKYPFEAKNVEIRIFIYNSGRFTYNFGDLLVIKAISGNLIYNIDDISGHSFITVHKESFEEALKRIDARTQIEKQSDLKSA